jgi:hypothetical protein
MKKVLANYCSSRGQRVVLSRWCLILLSCFNQLSLTNGMHNFNAGDRTARSPKGLEPEHRTDDAFHCSMVLFNEVVKVLGVADEDRSVVGTVVLLKRRGIRATLIDCNLFREPVVANGLV